MIDAANLLSDLQKLLVKLEDDIRRRCETVAEVNAPLRQQYDAAREANRTAQAFTDWRDEQITQAAVAWILGCVFVRFCEDNRLIDPPLLAGSVGERLNLAKDHHTLFFQDKERSSLTDREFLLNVFETVAKLPAMRELFDRRHNPLWSLGPTGDGAMMLREFWLTIDPETGQLAHDFTDAAATGGDWTVGGADPTRFLGDLYQDLSESARKRFALLQTPVFVEEFILDRTLTPAIREFGYETVRLIDPTCGSGHFLLGAFHRLAKLHLDAKPKENVRHLVQLALGQVYGVDLNPFAIAIARFRLLVAALRVCGVTRLADAPGFHFNLASGDSLLHGPRPGRMGSQVALIEDEDDEMLKHHYETEDAESLAKYLGQQYHAVVGNPPYITPKDKRVNEAYRERFGSCHMKYSLGVPFFERFIDLTLGSTHPESARQVGYFGKITTNSFMKREFGRKLVESYMPRWDLTAIIDTSGAYIPGCGTPTVIIFGRHRRPVTGTIRTAMGIAGEPGTPDDPSRGLVWTAITSQLDQPGSVSKFVSINDTARESFNRHPWSIGGGGAAELKEMLDEQAEATIAAGVASAGFMAIAGDEDVYLSSSTNDWRRRRVERSVVRGLMDGLAVRDWDVSLKTWCAFDYEGLRLNQSRSLERHLWTFRNLLRSAPYFGKTKEQRSLNWRDWAIVVGGAFSRPESIVFPTVATHNHFVRVGAEMVGGSTVQVIKLKPDATEDDHLGLLGLLNCSTACFWLRQVCFPKGGDHVGQEGARVRRSLWDERFAFNSGNVEGLPVPEHRPLFLARLIDTLAREYSASVPDAAVSAPIPSATTFVKAREKTAKHRGRMIALQEELDWQCYRLYGVIPGNRAADLESADPENVPAIELGQRAFEIVLARQVAANEVETSWFERHGSTPITEVPSHWPEAYRRLVERRIREIETNANIALIEKPEYKRRWNSESWDELQERALRGWLLDRLEGWPLANAGEDSAESTGPRSLFWDEGHPQVMSVAQLADRLGADEAFRSVAALYRGREDFDLTKLVAELVADESVPDLSVLRYKEPGLRKRKVWEDVWEQQRLEDRLNEQIEREPDATRKAELKAQLPKIPVPPKYTSADMLPGPTWRLRGKLDVPKERWVSLPYCQRDADPTMPVLWAGFDHLQQVQAIIAYYQQVKDEEGWPAERRVPLLAAMLELLPWVKQWHNDVHPEYGVRLGDDYEGFVKDEARGMAKTLDEIRAWTPPAKAKGRAKKT